MVFILIVGALVLSVAVASAEEVFPAVSVILAEIVTCPSVSGVVTSRLHPRWQQQLLYMYRRYHHQ
ncbi:hypothetical protein ACOBV8_03650 [Pseudoalteromonas espejiana]